MSFLTPHNLILLDARRHGVQVTGFGSHLAMVLAVVNHGSIGDGIHGSAAHLDAIRQVIAQCNTVIAALQSAAVLRGAREAAIACNGFLTPGKDVSDE